jgi:hypothetical protein
VSIIIYFYLNITSFPRPLAGGEMGHLSGAITCHASIGSAISRYSRHQNALAHAGKRCHPHSLFLAMFRVQI